MDIDITEKLNDCNLLKYKNLPGLFSRKDEICQTWKNQCVLHFRVPVYQKLLRLYHNTDYIYPLVLPALDIHFGSRQLLRILPWQTVFL